MFCKLIVKFLFHTIFTSSANSKYIKFRFPPKRVFFSSAYCSYIIIRPFGFCFVTISMFTNIYSNMEDIIRYLSCFRIIIGSVSFIKAKIIIYIFKSLFYCITLDCFFCSFLFCPNVLSVINKHITINTILFILLKNFKFFLLYYRLFGMCLL